MDLWQIYSQIIIENSRSNKHRNEMDATATERGYNPSCGDDIHLRSNRYDGLLMYLHRIRLRNFSPSTSLLCGLIKGKTLNAKHLLRHFGYDRMKLQMMISGRRIGRCNCAEKYIYNAAKSSLCCFSMAHFRFNHS